MIKVSRKWLFFSALLAIFCMMLLFNWFTPLSADDYAYMYHYGTGEPIQTLGDVFSSGAVHYQMMNGRVVTTAFLTPMLLLLGQRTFHFLNTLVYIALIFGIYRIARGKETHDWLLLLTVHAAVFLFAPAFGATTLWLSGACNYLWGTALIVYALMPFAWAVMGEKPPGRWQQVFFSMAALFAGNVVENTSVAMLILMGLCLLWLWIREKQLPLFLLVLLALATVGCGVLMNSPGLALDRRSADGLGEYLDNFMDCVARLQGKQWILFGYVFLFFLSIHGKKDHGRIAVSAGLVLCGLLANFAMVIPDYYPRRADMGWVIFWLIACGLLIPSLKELGKGIPWRGFATCLILMAMITCLYALPRNYDRYRQAQAQVAEVVAQREEGNLEATIFGIKSLSPYDVYCDGARLSGNPKYLLNVCFAKYYGLQSVAVTNDLY